MTESTTPDVAPSAEPVPALPAEGEPAPASSEASNATATDAVPASGATPNSVVEPALRPAEPSPELPPAVLEASMDGDLRVAHVLLRSGNALPARVLLETMAGGRRLDVRGLLDLAESRWRTGDLGGAGEAIVAYLEAGGEDPVGYLIAAEATSVLGRPGEARKLARRALEGLTIPLDAVFAGQPRSSIWPHDPAAPAQSSGTLFAPPATAAARGGRIGLTADPRPTAASGAPSPTASGATPSSAQAATADASSTATPTTAERAPDQSLWDTGRDAPMARAAAELDAAREALAANDSRAVAMRLGVVLRLSPALAPAVLDMVGQLPGADFDLLRGDALRLVGHEAAAERAFAAAADSLRDQPPTRSPE